MDDDSVDACAPCRYPRMNDHRDGDYDEEGDDDDDDDDHDDDDCLDSNDACGVSPHCCVVAVSRGVGDGTSAGDLSRHGCHGHLTLLNPTFSCHRRRHRHYYYYYGCYYYYYYCYRGVDDCVFFVSKNDPVFALCWNSLFGGGGGGGCCSSSCCVFVSCVHAHHHHLRMMMIRCPCRSCRRQLLVVPQIHLPRMIIPVPTNDDDDDDRAMVVESRNDHHDDDDYDP